MSNTNLTPTNRAMWRAYAIAPAVTPIAFFVLLVAVGAIATAAGAEINPAAFLVLPVLAFTVGLAACYLVAALIGMPIAFYLRRRNSLNAFTIHASACCWGVLFSVLCASASVGGKWSGTPWIAAYFCVGVVPPVMLSGTAFWALLGRIPPADASDVSPSVSSSRPI